MTTCRAMSLVVPGRMITKRKSIRSGQSLWEHLRAPVVQQRTLARDIDTEILVVGAGITGAMIGDVLCEAGFETTVVERRRATTEQRPQALRWCNTKSTRRCASSPVKWGIATPCVRGGGRVLR